MAELTASGISTELVGRRVRLQAAPRGRLRSLARSAHKVSGLAVALGAEAGGSPVPIRGPHDFCHPLLYPRAREATGHGLRLRDLRDGAVRRRGEHLLGRRGPFQNAYVGYWIDQAQAGRGYVPEACVLLFRFAFEEIGLHRLQISIIPRNRPSRRVAQKLWLRGEGIALRYLEIDGRLGGPRPLRIDGGGVGRAPRPVLTPVALRLSDLQLIAEPR